MIKQIFKNIILFITFISSLSANNIEKKVSVQLLWKHQFEFAGFYIAKEKGFYKDLGLDVELKEYKFGTNITKDVESGKSTFGVGYPSIILDKSNGADIILLNAIYQSSPHILITLNSSGIKKLQDFKGKRIMMENDAIKTAPLLSMLYSKHIKPSDLKLIKPSFDIDDLINKKTDILSAYISNEVYKLDKKGIKYTIWDPKNYGFDFYNDIIFTSTKMAQNNSDVVDKFQEATLKGWIYAFAHIDETINLILRKYNTQNKTKEALAYEARVLKKLAYKDNKPFGALCSNKLQRIYDIYNLMGFTKNIIDTKKFIYHSKSTNQIKWPKYLTEEEIRFIKNNIIKVGLSPWYPITSYNYRTKMASGIGVDILGKIVQRLHLNIKYVPNQWSKLLNDFKAHKIDLLPTTYYTEQRAKFGDYTTGYIAIKEYLYVRQDSHINGFADLNGKTLAMVKSYGTIDKIKKLYPDIKIVEVDTLEETIRMLLNNKADAIFNTQFSIETFLRSNLILGLKPIYQTDFKPSSLHYFSNTQKPLLHSILQKALDHIDTKKRDNIIKQWLNSLAVNKSDKTVKNSHLTKKEKEYISKYKIIKMCNNPNWEPIEFAKDGDIKNMQGIVIDTLKLLEKKLNVKFQNVPTKSWSQSQQFLKEKKCDILPAAIKTAKRSRYALFTKPYLDYKLAVITKNDKPFVKGLDAIIDKSISRKKGSGLIQKLKSKYPNVNIVETKDYIEALQKVSSGDVYCTIATLPVASYFISQFALNNLQIAGYIDMHYKLSIAVRDDNPDLANILDKTLATITKKEKNKIYDRWSNVNIKEKFDYKILWNMLVVVSIVFIFFFYRQYLLNRSNKDLTKAVEQKTKDLKELNDTLEQRVKEEVEKNIQIQKQLFKSEKMAAMGEMIGNIAHQWRQPLSVISTGATGILLKKEYGVLDDEFLIETCETINNNTQYLSKTIDDFRNFIKGNRERCRFNLFENIESFLHLVEGAIKNNNIHLELDIDKTIEIDGYANELIQCYINIFNNAKDVLKENDTLEERLFFISAKLDGDFVIIKLKDNAGGIPADVLPKIFEPYFTTKHQSQGTGLGLHMTYNIITDGMKGTIEAKNEEFEYHDIKYTGAVFIIAIPISGGVDIKVHYEYKYN